MTDNTRPEGAADPMTKWLDKRIQRQRTRGWRMPAGAAYVGRPTIYANPWAIVATGDGQWGVSWVLTDSTHRPTDPAKWFVTCDTREQAHQSSVDLYREYYEAYEALREVARRHLEGKGLACWCSPPLACHVDVLLADVNGRP